MDEKEKPAPPIPVEWVKAKADESYKDGTLYRFNVLCWLWTNGSMKMAHPINTVKAYLH